MSANKKYTITYEYLHTLNKKALIFSVFFFILYTNKNKYNLDIVSCIEPLTNLYHHATDKILNHIII